MMGCRVIAGRLAVTAWLMSAVVVGASPAAGGGRLSRLGAVAVRRIVVEEVTVFTPEQLAGETLPPLERFTVGGLDTVRGYPENLLVRDNGLVLSGELRVPIVRHDGGRGVLALAPFVDLGDSWHAEGHVPGHTGEPRTIASAGLGLRWGLRDRL